jgi:hypothetical protein
MRLFGLFALVLCLAPIAGCGDDSSAVDMSAAGNNCLAVVTCAGMCNGNMTCVSGCIAKGTPKAMTEFNNLFMCAYGVCTKPGDGGAAACSSNSDGSTGCVTCVTNSGQSPSCMTQLSACLGNT